MSRGAALPPRAVSVATAGRVPRIDIARDLGLRARLAGHLPTSTPQARVYITRHPPPRYPQITAYKANFIGTCMQYAQGGRIAPQPTRPDCFDIRASCSYINEAVAYPILARRLFRTLTTPFLYRYTYLPTSCVSLLVCNRDNYSKLQIYSE